jgi:ribosome-associated heat shock protein Hsp15
VRNKFAGGRESPQIRGRFVFNRVTSIPVSDRSAARLDKWLWAMRVFKTRPLATDACRAGSVAINELVAKPAREVRAGEIVTVKQGMFTRTLRVVGVPRSRVGAKLLPEFCVDLTPPEEFERLRERSVQQLLAREKGSGRPTKRDRRLLDDLFE